MNGHGSGIHRCDREQRGGVIENMQEDPGAIDEEMAKIMEKHPGRKV